MIEHHGVQRTINELMNPMQRIAVYTVGSFEKDEDGYVYE